MILRCKNTQKSDITNNIQKVYQQVFPLYISRHIPILFASFPANTLCIIKLSRKIFVSSQQKFSTMKVFMIEIYNDEMVAKMQRLKDEKGITFASQCRAGLKMYFKEIESKQQQM